MARVYETWMGHEQVVSSAGTAYTVSMYHSYVGWRAMAWADINDPLTFVGESGFCVRRSYATDEVMEMIEAHERVTQQEMR